MPASRIQLFFAITMSALLLLSTATRADLIAHWPLNEGSGTTANDTSPTPIGGSSNDGALFFDAQLISGEPVRGNVLLLDGTEDYVELAPHVSDFAPLSTGTLTAWFRHDSTAIGSILTVSDADAASTESRFFVENDRVRYDLRDGGGDPAGEGGMVAGAEGVSDGAWHHAAATVDGTAQVTKFYVDGRLVGQAFEPLWGDITDAVDVLDNMAMGRNIDSGGPQWHFNGALSDIAIYDTVLTHGQVMDVMQSGVSAAPLDLPVAGPRTSGVIAHYKFNEQAPGSAASSGDVLVDETGNHNGEILVDTLSYVAGQDGSALHFDEDMETSNRTAVANDEEFQILPGESFMVEATIRTTAEGTRGIVSKNGNGGEFWMRLQDGEVRFFLNDNVGTAVDVQSDATEGEVANTGEWVHIAGVYDAANEELRLYLDSQLVDSDVAPATFAAPIGGDSNPVVFGDFVGTDSRKFIGDIDDVRISIIPEPASLGLLVWGLSVCWLGRRRLG